MPIKIIGNIVAGMMPPKSVAPKPGDPNFSPGLFQNEAGEMVPPPEFDGWWAVGIDTEVEDNDVFVRIFDPHCHKYKTPDQGDKVSGKPTVGQIPSKKFGIDNCSRWCLYRPIPGYKHKISETWMELSGNDHAKTGDIVIKDVCDGIPSKLKAIADHDSSGLGFVVHGWHGRLVSDILNEMDGDGYDSAAVFRKVTDGETFSRKLPGNKHYSAALPLP